MVDPTGIVTAVATAGGAIVASIALIGEGMRRRSNAQQAANKAWQEGVTKQMDQMNILLERGTDRINNLSDRVSRLEGRSIPAAPPE